RSRAAAPPPPAEAVATPDTAVVLQVQSDVPGASVFLDREFVGTTPLTLRNLAAGSKQLNVTATGHEGYAETIDLAAGDNRVNVEFLKVRLNVSIPVVHRHAMGSCQGMLAATLKGMTYDTANKSDAFTLPFADLDEFEVDYLKKNLRVRRRAGKTWNFTNDSADVLFVFHRDVNKARGRLATPW
ncbi:MAG: PEGA domain-containing protein, partial [Vicinamibacterales bacterium]